MEENLHAEVRERALRLLARREHSERELAGKLAQRGYERTVVDEVIADLAAERLVSDERFAEEFVRARSGQGFGPLRIRADLARRGVDDALITPHLSDDAQWVAAASELHRKRYGDAPPQDVREKARRTRYLANRGFTAEQVRRVVGGLEDE
ncbi:regulatory protein RecX [Arhodomonas sp. AD133]|uniref:regulatory protein RecX n=1 Tax=Arhodomonas sp. AD133 TaxID=3415009 RepID=UPI003EC0C975